MKAYVLAERKVETTAARRVVQLVGPSDVGGVVKKADVRAEVTAASWVVS